jgi:hypothetical protein
VTGPPAHWKLSEKDVQLLLARFDRKQPSASADAFTESDLRDYMRMKKRFTYKIYARLTPITTDTLQITSDGEGVCWSGTRGWFDELVKINQRRSADNGWAWTGSRLADEDADEDLDDSYSGMDIANWELLQERDRSLSMEPSEAAFLDEQIEPILEVL